MEEMVGMVGQWSWRRVDMSRVIVFRSRAWGQVRGSIRWLVVVVVVRLVVGIVGCFVGNMNRIRHFNFDMFLADVLDLFVTLLFIFNILHGLVLCLAPGLNQSHSDTQFKIYPLRSKIFFSLSQFLEQ